MEKLRTGAADMQKNSESALSTGELIRLELAGKNVALGRYDTLLWQVRSGFVIILYGALALLFKDGLKPKDMNTHVVLLVSGFSALAYAMDIAFRIRQLRVVKAYNLLMDQALKQAFGEPVNAGALHELLHLAGESHVSLDRSALLRAILLIFAFYASTPLMIGFLRFL
jgi:hypothetical protein